MPWINPSPTVYCKVQFTEGNSAIAFDFDDSLVKRGTSTPLPDVVARLPRDQDIVIFSNQKRANASDIQRLMDQFAAAVPDLKLSFFFSTGSDEFRKPSHGMFSLAKTMGLGDVSYYAGDASGRKGDFSISDLYFAHNTGMKYIDARIPSAKDIGFKPALSLYKDDVWKDGFLQNPRLLPELGTDHSFDTDVAIELDDESGFQLVLMVGPQAVGKSRTSATLKEIGAQIINGDDLRTKARMHTRFKSLAAAGHKIIVIDNTNGKRETRDEWRKLAEEAWGKGFKVSVIWFNLSKDAAFHAVRFRTSRGGSDVPAVAVHTYFKYLVPPMAEEGRIIEVKSIITDRPDMLHNFRSA